MRTAFQNAAMAAMPNGVTAWMATPDELPDDELDAVIRTPRDPQAVRKLADMVDDGEATE